MKLSLLEYKEKAQAKKPISAGLTVLIHLLPWEDPWKLYYPALALEPPALPFLLVEQKSTIHYFVIMLIMQVLYGVRVWIELPD